MKEEKKTTGKGTVTQEVFSFSPGHVPASVPLRHRAGGEGSRGDLDRQMEDLSIIISFNDPTSPWVLVGLIPALTGIHRRRFALKYSFVKHAGH